MTVQRIPRLWPAKPRREELPPEPLGIDAFSSESESAVAASHEPIPFPQGAAPADVRARRPGRIAIGAVLLAALAGSGAYYFKRHPVPWLSSDGSVTFETAPAGQDVVVAGRNIGRTPVKVSLPPGSYEVRLGAGPAARAFTVAVSARTSVIQHYELSPPAQPAPAKGSLQLQTERAHQPIFVDGVERGTSPLVLDGIDAGEHLIAIRTDRGPIERTVQVTAGQMTSVILASPQPTEAPVTTAGWLSVSAPIPLQIREGGRLLGSTDVDRLMMASGDHVVELVDEGLGFRAQRNVRIVGGKTVALKVEVPNGTMSLNAVPWADVYINGQRVGQTPIGNLSRPIGRYEVVFRNPTLGERREVVTVTALQTARLGVDLRK